MPDLKFVTDEAAGDRDKLLHFLETAEAFFGQLVQDGGALFSSQLRELATAAWADVAHQFKEVRHGVASEWGDKLHEAGLSGPQLAFKLGVVERLHRTYVNEPNAESLGHLLEATANVLDSIVIATKTGEALKEFQQAMRLALYDSPA